MFTRSLFILMMCIQVLQLPAQERSITTQKLGEIYHHTQSFNFKIADSLLKQISSSENKAILSLAKANYLWWQIISGDDNNTNRSLYVQSSDAAIGLLKSKDVASLSNDQLYTIITAYANKARIEGLNKNYLKGFVHINTCLKHIQKSFGKEKDFIYFNLTSGLYNYYMATANKNFPVLLPYLALFPSGDLERGKKMLITASESSDVLLATEGHYFLFKMYFEEEEYISAETQLEWLLKKYPDNLLYNYYRFKIFLNQNKKDQALDVMTTIRLKEMMNKQLSPSQKSYYSSLATKDLKEYYMRKQ